MSDFVEWLHHRMDEEGLVEHIDTPPYVRLHCSSAPVVFVQEEQS